MKLPVIVAFLSIGAFANTRAPMVDDLALVGREPHLARADESASVDLVADHDEDHGHHGEQHRDQGHGHGQTPNRGWGPRPGWHSSWRYERNYHPHWYRPQIVFPGFLWLNIDPGVWQCTAFNQYDQYLAPYSYVARGQGQAAYGALYDCGGPNYQAAGCFIPPGYCQRR